jgi:hypothetical protein
MTDTVVIGVVLWIMVAALGRWVQVRSQRSRSEKLKKSE